MNRKQDTTRDKINKIHDTLSWISYNLSYCQLDPTKADMRDLDRAIDLLANLESMADK